MRKCRLRTVYELSGIGLKAGLVLLLAEGATVSLVTESRLLIMEDVRVTGRGSDGNVSVTGRNVEKVFRGNPLLLQIEAELECPDEDQAPSHRPQLEAITAKVESMISWALPHVVGVKLADSLYTRLPVDPQDTWEWFDVSKFSTSDYYDEPERLVSRCQQIEQSLRNLSDSHRELTLTALRWWRYARILESPADEVVAFWISIESSSSVFSKADSIRQRVLSALSASFPDLASQDNGRRIRSMRDLLYNSRCATVHSGRRDLKAGGSVVSLADLAASACIRFAIDQQTTDAPPENVLNQLGI